MKSFSAFIAEARVSQTNFSKAASIFRRLIERKFRTKLYRFGGEAGFVEINKGQGILYIYDQTKALRLNYIGGQIASLTVWDSYKVNQPGSATIDLGGSNLTAAASKVIEIIRGGCKPGEYDLADDPHIHEGVLTEARRVALDTFAEIVKRNLPRQYDFDKVPWPVLSDIAIANDILIPTVVRSYMNPKRRGDPASWNIQQIARGKEPGAQLPLGDDPDADVDIRRDDPPEESDEVHYIIKVTKMDPVTREISSIRGDKKAQEILRRVTDELNNPSKEEIEKAMRDPDELFGLLSNLTKLVSRGSRNALVVYGRGGLGKTHTVVTTLNEEGLNEDADFYMIKGNISTVSLYQTLFAHRDGDILVFDDCDSVWGDDTAANILKAALDSYDVRKISWSSARTINVGKLSQEAKDKMNKEIDDTLQNDPDAIQKIKYPSTFTYTGRIIFISNLSRKEMDPAVLTRSAKIDMTLNDREIFVRMNNILPHMGNKEVDIETKREILGFLQAQNESGLLSEPSMRMYLAAESLYLSGIPDWKKLLDYV